MQDYLWILSKQNSKNVGNNSMIPKSKRDYFYQTYHRQSFSLPNSILYQIAKNPLTAKVYSKLVQTCKYFFFKNPILVTTVLMYTDCDGWEGWTHYVWKPIDLKNVSSKIWITEELTIDTKNNKNFNFATVLAPKIFRCDIIVLFLSNQILSYDEFVLCAATTEQINFQKVTVKHQDGSIVPLEKLVKITLRLKRLYHTVPSTITAITSKTVGDLLKLPHFLTLDDCGLRNIPQDFDIKCFYAHMKVYQFILKVNYRFF